MIEWFIVLSFYLQEDGSLHSMGGGHFQTKIECNRVLVADIKDRKRKNEFASITGYCLQGPEKPAGLPAFEIKSPKNITS